jgi:hypothetical protein
VAPRPRAPPRARSRCRPLGELVVTSSSSPGFSVAPPRLMSRVEEQHVANAAISDEQIIAFVRSVCREGERTSAPRSRSLIGFLGGNWAGMAPTHGALLYR